MVDLKTYAEKILNSEDRSEISKYLDQYCEDRGVEFSDMIYAVRNWLQNGFDLFISHNNIHDNNLIGVLQMAITDIPIRFFDSKDFSRIAYTDGYSVYFNSYLIKLFFFLTHCHDEHIDLLRQNFKSKHLSYDDINSMNVPISISLFQLFIHECIHVSDNHFDLFREEFQKVKNNPKLLRAIKILANIACDLYINKFCWQTFSGLVKRRISGRCVYDNHCVDYVHVILLRSFLPKAFHNFCSPLSIFDPQREYFYNISEKHLWYPLSIFYEIIRNNASSGDKSSDDSDSSGGNSGGSGSPNSSNDPSGNSSDDGLEEEDSPVSIEGDEFYDGSEGQEETVPRKSISELLGEQAKDLVEKIQSAMGAENSNQFLRKTNPLPTTNLRKIIPVLPTRGSAYKSSSHIDNRKIYYQHYFNTLRTRYHKLNDVGVVFIVDTSASMHLEWPKILGAIEHVANYVDAEKCFLITCDTEHKVVSFKDVLSGSYEIHADGGSVFSGIFKDDKILKLYRKHRIALTVFFSDLDIEPFSLSEMPSGKLLIAYTNHSSAYSFVKEYPEFRKAFYCHIDRLL